MPPLDVDGYLARLRIPEPGPPSAAALHALHAAHVERIPYEALEIQLGRPTTIDPLESADRIIRGHRGGYCYHLNGAFSLLLGELGYDVARHRAGVQSRSAAEPPGTAWGNHLALTVSGLVTQECPSGEWLVDTGLGDAVHEPLPLHEGEYVQGPFRYRLSRSETEPGCWRFDHDLRGSFGGMEFGPAGAVLKDFEERHAYLSTSPESGFVRTSAVQRRDATGADTLTGLVLRRVPGESRTLEKKSEWFEALADVFDLPLTDEDPATRERLWRRVLAAHEARASGNDLAAGT